MIDKIDLRELIVENFDRVDGRYQAMLASMGLIMLATATKKLDIHVAANLLCMIPEIAGEEPRTAMNNARRLVELFNERVEALENRAN